MLIDMRKDAPDQANTVDPDKLSTEVEKLKSIQNEIKSFEGKVVLISFQDNTSNSKEFLNKYGYGNLIYLTDSKSKFAINSGVFGVPETHIIQNGVIIRKYLGPLTFGDVEEIIFLYS